MPPKPKKIEVSSEAARRIRELRESRGETQTSFARALGTGPSAISKWEAGRNQPQPKIFAKLANLAAGEAKRFFQVLAGLNADESSAYFDGSSLLPKVGNSAQHPTSGQAKRSSRADSHMGPGWDPELLAIVIEAMNKKFKVETGTLSDREYAEKIAFYYELCHRMMREDPTMVERFLKTA
jgi:transcriptional regulator with XRE-family HTH domain